MPPDSKNAHLATSVRQRCYFNLSVTFPYFSLYDCYIIICNCPCYCSFDSNVMQIAHLAVREHFMNLDIEDSFHGFSEKNFLGCFFIRLVLLSSYRLNKLLIAMYSTFFLLQC